LLPNARLVEVSDSYTLIMRDQPEQFARAIREFVGEARGAAVTAAN
jgi:pimeloyl-ACP methyl ester carboxylesterase